MSHLDSQLAEYFHSVYRQRRSGVLDVRGPGRAMRFCFEDGSPVAIDLCVPKEQRLAQTLEAYHRLDAGQSAEVIAGWQAGEGTVGDLVVAKGYASELEVAYSVQAMVEDGLCAIFVPGIDTIDFDERLSIEDLDFDQRAFRLRIDTDALLSTVESRLAEQETLYHQFSAYRAVFAFHEDSPGSGALEPEERRVIDVIDGRSSLLDISVILRDHERTVARIAAKLVAKKVIRRVDHHQFSPNQTTVQSFVPAEPAAATGTANARATVAEAALRSATPTMRDFTPYHQQERVPPRSNFMTVVLALVLALVAFLAVLVYRNNLRQQELAAASQRLEGSLAKADWQAARMQLDEARVKAGQDLSDLQFVEQLESRFKGALAAEFKAIRALADNGDFAIAQQRIAALIPSPEVEQLRLGVVIEEGVSRSRSNELASKVEPLLVQDDGMGAKRLIDESPIVEREKVRAEELIDRWRISRFELATAATAPYGKRVNALRQVLASMPRQRLLDQVPAVEADIAKREAALRSQVAALSDLVGKGRFDEASTVLGTGDLDLQLTGTALERDLKEVKDRLARSRAALADVVKRTTDALVDVDHPELLASAREYLAKIDGAAIPGLRELQQRALVLLTDVEAIPIEQPPAVQITALMLIQERQGQDPRFVQALANRSERLSGLVQRALSMLDTARGHVRDGRFDTAQKVLDDLIARPELRGTQSRATALVERDELIARVARVGTLRKQLNEVIARGDIPAANAIARELGMRSLPLSIESVPSGATVSNAGRVLGVTPLILDLPLAERVDQVYDIQLPGYRSVQAKAADAEAGWHLATHLDREPLGTFPVGGTVTSQPIVVDGRVIVSGRTGMALIDGAGTARWVDFGAESVENPIRSRLSTEAAAIFIPTRDKVAMHVVPSAVPTVQRISLPVGTELPTAIFSSTVIIDRRLRIIAGLDGALHAQALDDPRVGWKGPQGAPFVTAPWIVGDQVYALRRDGRIDRLQADDGVQVDGLDLGVPVVGAWATPKGVAGCSAHVSFTVSDGKLVQEELPIEVVAANAEVRVAINGKVQVREQNGAWKDVGRCEEKLTAEPRAWMGHAALPLGNDLLVLGTRGFRIHNAAAFLSPQVLGDRLLAITEAGQCLIYGP